MPADRSSDPSRRRIATIDTYLQHASHGLWCRRGGWVICPCGAKLYRGRVHHTRAAQRNIAMELMMLVADAADLTAPQAEFRWAGIWHRDKGGNSLYYSGEP